MFRWQTRLGIVIGLAVGFGFLALTGSPAKRPPPSGPILSESDGMIHELVIQYEPSAKEIVAPVYHDFLGALDADILVHVVCPDRVAYEEFTSFVGRVRCKVLPILVHHPITTWSRDRWVALQPIAPGGLTTLLSPRCETAEELWPARAGDELVGKDIASALRLSVFARHSDLRFDGGDFLADKENVFVTPRVLRNNLQHTVAGREELLRILSGEFKRRTRFLDKAPEHHAGMFLASVGNKTMLVGDPSLGRRFVPLGDTSEHSRATNEFMGLPGGPDFNPETQQLFDAVADQCAEAGYKVIRIATVPGCDGRSYLTYVNVIIDQRDGHRIVYLPFYRGAEPLNAAGRAVWESLGYEIRPVDCSSTYRHFGCLHCLVNVLKRS
jgi:hypothetical protein